MGELFNNVYYARERNGILEKIKVPVSYSSKEKFISTLNKINTPISDSTAAKVETILPRMCLNMIDIAYAPEFKTNILNKQIKNIGYAGNRVSIFNPVPYKISFQMGIYTRHEGDMLNIVEQIIPYFQPHFTCNIKEIIKEHTIKRDINIHLTSVMIDEDADGDTSTRRRLEWTLMFDLIGWIYPPSDDIAGEIKTIYLDFVAGEHVLGDGSNLEQVIISDKVP